jgi:HPt (histidine-containing phosphotransfer) domain-containing protein
VNSLPNYRQNALIAQVRTPALLGGCKTTDTKRGATTTMDSESFQGSGESRGKTPAISEAEFQALVEMVGADMPEVVVDSLDTYLQESAGLVEEIRSGERAGDFKSMLRPAHSLKSSSASIGAIQLSKLCTDLESHLRGSLPGLDIPTQVQRIEDEFARVEVELNATKSQLGG